jgi:hypothetical protein
MVVEEVREVDVLKKAVEVEELLMFFLVGGVMVVDWY